MRSMTAGAALAPQIKALRTKYADDEQRQEAETMALYEEHGVNAVAGCLPMPRRELSVFCVHSTRYLDGA